MSLLDKVKDAGVIGAGGAGFPTHVKLAAKAEYILLNGAECEPLLRVDQQLMEIFPDEIIKGFEAARKLVEAKKGIIGIKGKHKKVISILKDRIISLQLGDLIEVKELPDIYPAGDEQVLVYELTGRIVPEVGIPIQVGCVVVNSETALNIYNASLGKPVIEKYITISGDVPKPITVKVPVGTKTIDVLKLSGIKDFSDYAVIDGGPMMGPVMKNLDGYITKKNKGFIILRKDHSLIRKKSVKMSQAKRINRSACEQCRMCTDMCPRYLLGHNTQPHKMMRAIAYNMDNMEEQKISQLCCQCNLCELFSCPAGLYPKTANLYFKQKLAEKNIKYKPVKDKFEARQAREYRLVPSKRLIYRLGLRDFDKQAPLTDVLVEPDTVCILKQQHVGAPAVCSVNIGDHVQAGDLIGKIKEGSLGANIHASISGTITDIGNEFITIRRD
ncbi:4Fe-4S dicluster domain-containing protein [Clostridium chauvoei]|uniref:4Fe-4S dicluster domain-containing protein n=2 Tax=Clostridium chauvoei TaxID=46867 RepID=A0ABD4RGP2_9CLOT|nr:4Fe-4S dicluster domain-containing protein [Clostridium chauvoei]ATD55737.1 NADH dehydrogenase [Clostridium chauvoei]ATD56587.1 NADH dehydrogenase [Clostridium chauvoei]MBX7280282.1 4Fe-4S dicluster domain-containing protein [Clostridium chauvoei]MBX7282767.1 4Fe-4S dicluster domain-containing protein [Clostridium chauvoei]MBX7285173.1 4Fe-4S dicluster domain-containing protein [Clostridium chauvoei]